MLSIDFDGEAAVVTLLLYIFGAMDIIIQKCKKVVISADSNSKINLSTGDHIITIVSHCHFYLYYKINQIGEYREENIQK